MFQRMYGEELAAVICDDEGLDLDYESWDDNDLEEWLNAWGYFWHDKLSSWLHEGYLAPPQEAQP